MAEHKIYSTEAKNCIFQAISKQEKSFSASELADYLAYLGHKHSISTIYRILEELHKNGILGKNHDKNGTTRYVLLEKCNKLGHFYLICSKCNEAIHVDCDEISRLYSHLSAEHSFQIDAKNLQLSGICQKCQEKQ